MKRRTVFVASISVVAVLGAVFWVWWTSPLPTKRTTLDFGPDGKLDIRYQYTPEGITTGDSNARKGLHRHYFELQRRLQSASTLDEWLACYTKETAESMDDKTRDRMAKRIADKQPGEPFRASTVFLALSFEDKHGKHLVFCNLPSPNAKLVDAILVSVLTEENGQWLRDNKYRHPLLDRVGSHKLSDFGGRDLPRERADELQREARAATQRSR